MIISKGMDIHTLEQEIYGYCCAIGREMLKNILTEIDNKLMHERDRRAYRHKGKRGTTLKTMMGEVEYERVLYEHEQEDGKTGRIYLLEQELGFETIGYISDLLVEKIAETSCELSYRKTAQTVSELTGQNISHTGVWNVVQTVGKRLDKKERQSAIRAKNNESIGKIETKLLFEEQDGVYLNLQGKDRQKSGKSAEMKIAIAYTGAKKTGKYRYNLVEKVACAHFEGVNSFYDRKEGVIAETYDVDEIEMRILNGDGASWIKRSLIDDTVHYQLDTFHRNKAVMRHVFDTDARKTIFKLLYTKQIDLLLDVIEAYSNSTEDENLRENYLELLNYFRNNKDGLISYKHRELDLPPTPDGLEYRGGGAMESNVFSIISHRMKHRRASWSIKGGNNLAKLLTLKATGKLSKTLSALASIVLPERYAEEVQTVLSAANIPQRTGKGYNGFAHAVIPPSMPWMKDLFALKPIC
jgi:hypothetical protein